jgi:hypothetical protein
MNEKIKNLYNLLIVLFQWVEGGDFIIYTTINGDRLLTKVSCSKYAKFVINDFKALENKYGKSIYTMLEPEKIKTLFAISDQYEWFSRKELVEFLESEFSNKLFIMGE